MIDDREPHEPESLFNLAGARDRDGDQELRDVAVGVIAHQYAGSCPDPLHPDDRAPSCRACQVLVAAAAW